MKKTITIAALTLSLGALAGPAHADAAAGGHDRMPNVTGRSLVAAYQALHYDIGVQLKDGSGAHRHVLWPNDWKVCAQRPAPGTHLKDQRITLTVVKKREECARL